MTPAPALPDGYTVRLHDGVEPGTFLVAGSRVLRLSSAARRLIVERTVTVTSSTAAALADRLLDLDLATPVVDGVADTSLDEVTVVVPVRDNAAGVDRLLGALAPRLRCIVVDDASTSPRALAEVVERHGAHLVQLDHNVGPAAARNVGLHEVSTPFVAFVDSDVQVSVESLLALATHFADPRLAAVGPRIRTPDAGGAIERYEAACGALDLGPVAATVRPWSPVTYLPSACLVARTDALGSGFDPTLRSGEDVDLVWRLQADGHRVRYAAEVHAQHDARTSLRGWMARKAFYGTSAAPLARLHGDRVAPAVMTRSVAAVSFGLLMGGRWSLLLAAVGAVDFVRQVGARPAELPVRRRAQVVAATGRLMAAQTSGLLLRHWWPVSVALAVASPRARRAVAVVAVADGLVAHRSAGVGLDPVRFTVARRLDDLAYGTGVWAGALHAGSVRCLLPRWTSSRAVRPAA